MDVFDYPSKTKLNAADIVIFGGTGDLASRKIVPALYFRLREKQLPSESRVWLIGRHPLDANAFDEHLRHVCDAFIPKQDFSEAAFEALKARLHYLAFDATDAAGYAQLAEHIQSDARPVRVFYLATPAEIFGTISQHIKAAELINDETRLVMEKPIGRDLASFKTTNEAVLSCFSEEQIYRIDHYLGKETVQNLMVLRFGNNLLERVWNGDAIDHVQITVAEDIGVGERFGYYDNYGALRDMVQNHLLQLLCLLAMEAPPYIHPTAVRDEKLKVLRSLRIIDAGNVHTHTVRGQYAEGTVNGVHAASYKSDIGGNDSHTESFVAMKVHVDNWRWSGIPFYLRTGKRLPQRYSEIVIQFKPVAHNIFPHQKEMPDTNKLVIRLQPDEYVNLQINTKVPGPGGYRLKPVNLNLSLAEEFEGRYPRAYERLLMDVIRGNLTLFMRTDELEAAWQWVEHILQGWEQTRQVPHAYAAGSWGPDAASKLLANDGRSWYGDKTRKE
ncbi:MAG: glucose-6-phosphate dehydrogenase [Rickettsiales bacterium]|nr:glucose-6-phosphate dehydrogenase [Rickettsiales bacterium]